MHKLLITILALVVFAFFYSCQQEEFTTPKLPENTAISVEEAQSWFEQHKSELSSAKSARKGHKDYTREPVWEQARKYHFQGREVIAAPLTNEKGHAGRGTVSKLLMHKNEQGQMQLQRLRLIGDQPFIDKKGFEQDDMNFSGIVRVEDWEGNLLEGQYYLNGQWIGVLKNAPATKAARRGGLDENNPLHVTIALHTDWYQQVCVGGSCGGWDYLGTSTTYAYVTLPVSGINYFGTFISNGSGGSGSGGNGGGSYGYCGITEPCQALPDPDLRPTVYIKEVVLPAAGPKPMAEYTDKCVGMQAMWSKSAANRKERIGFVTENGGLIETHEGTYNSIPIDGLIRHAGKTYYHYEQPASAPLPTWPGTLTNTSNISDPSKIRVYIPIVATVHTHNPCRDDGTNGVSHAVGLDDKTLATMHPHINHYVIGCGAVAQYNATNSQFYNVVTGALSSSCAGIR